MVTVKFKSLILITLFLVIATSVNAVYEYTIDPPDNQDYAVTLVNLTGTLCEGLNDVSIHNDTDELNFSWHNATKNLLVFVGTNNDNYTLRCDDGTSEHNGTYQIVKWIDCEGSFSSGDAWSNQAGVSVTCQGDTLRYDHTGGSTFSSLDFGSAYTNNYMSLTSKAIVNTSSYVAFVLSQSNNDITKSFRKLVFGATNRVRLYHYFASEQGAYMLDNQPFYFSLSVNSSCNGTDSGTIGCVDYWFNGTTYVNRTNDLVEDFGQVTSIRYLTFFSDNLDDEITIDELFICNGDCILYDDTYLPLALTESAHAFNLTVTGSTEAQKINFTNNLTYNLTYVCSPNSNSALLTFINGSVNKTDSLTCNNNINTFQGLYSPKKEGNFNISFAFNTSLENTLNNVTFNGTNYTADLTPPVVDYLDFSFDEGFQTNYTNVTLRCLDDMIPLIEYNLTFNDGQMFLGNLSNGTNQTNDTTLRFGNNTAHGICKDALYTSSAIEYKSQSVVSFVLIDEVTGELFNVSNLTSVKMYYSDNQTFYDLKANNTPYVNFSGSSDTKLRFELEYADGSIINRYIDASLLDASDNRICANKDGVTHYEQLLVSARQRRVIMYSLLANCMVAADYTRFAYQDSYILKAFTIDRDYYLYAYDNDERIYLASIDGSVQTYIQLDVLDYNRERTAINILTESLFFQRINDTSTIQIYYTNNANNNDNISVSITNLDTDTVVFSSSAFTNPNEFTLYFDYSTVANVTNVTIFKIAVTKYRDGELSYLNTYFNIAAKSGVLNSAFAFTISFLIMLFGLTFTVSRITFSWLGIVVILAALAFLAFSIATWYTLLLMAIELIILVFTFIVTVKINQETLT